VTDTLFVFNPSAQSGATGARWDEIARYADELEIAYRRVDTLPDEGTVDLVAAQAATRQYRTVAAVGGDGTVNEVIRGLMRAQDALGVPRQEMPALALIPAGTGNNVAKSFQIPRDAGLRKAVETVRFGADFPLDLGRVDEHYFADAFSIGVDSLILHERNLERRKVQRNPVLRQFLRDYALYAYVSLRFPWLSRNVRADLVLDGEPLHVPDLTNLVVNNTRIYAGEFVFEDDTRANDGLLDVVVFRGWREYLTRFVLAARITPINERMLNKMLRRRTATYRVKTLKVRLEQSMSSQLDGEMYRAGTSFDVEVVPRALTLKTPVAS